jgi:pimeloyl-ACP methyl ester carboxylesterase
MFRTRLAKQIVTEFLPPRRVSKTQRVIILCDGMPSIPRKQGLLEFLSRKGYWVFYPRYRGAWESDGVFMHKSPHLDILDVMSELPKGFRDLSFGQRFRVTPDQIFVIGGSFGGAAAILCSLDPRVRRVIANCPVVDWSILSGSEKAETSNPSYAAYIRQAFGRAYRLSDKNWNKLRSGKFYNPAYHMASITGSKIMMFHAQDDPYVPYASVKRFADRTGADLKSFRRGGHLSTERIVQKHWQEINRFFRSRSSKQNAGLNPDEATLQTRRITS